MKQLLFIVTLALAPLSPVFAWSECGHHIVAAIAFDLLTESEQSELLRILEAHPRYAEDFTPAKKIRNIERWRIGTAGYWPDIESLPGQLSLFHEAAPLKMDRAEIETTARQRRELFYTGKDLPGAKEREQVILWDVP